MKKSEGISLIGEYTFTIRDAKTGVIKRVYRQKNLIPLVARVMIANNLGSVTPNNDMAINYSSLGTGTTAPSSSDTKLVTETHRKQIASLTNLSNSVFASAFYQATEVTGTFYEAGLFCDGTALTDSGILFSRVLLNSPTGITKSETETLTIDYEVQINYSS